MDSLLVLGSFDIIAYLMAGLAAFFVLDLILGFGFLFRATWNAGSVTGIVLSAYLIGHLLSIPSRFLFEEVIADDCLRSPIVRLVPSLWRASDSIVASYICEPIRPYARHIPIRWIFGAEYFRTATHDVLSRVDTKLSKATSESFFHEAYQLAKHDSIAYERADIFQRLSLLFRNMAFLSLAALIAIAGKSIASCFSNHPADRHLIHYGVQPWMLAPKIQAMIFLLLTIGLLNRYLFFNRLFVSEIVTSFAYAPPSISF